MGKPEARGPHLSLVMRNISNQSNLHPGPGLPQVRITWLRCWDGTVNLPDHGWVAPWMDLRALFEEIPSSLAVYSRRLRSGQIAHLIPS